MKKEGYHCQTWRLKKGKPDIHAHAHTHTLAQSHTLCNAYIHKPLGSRELWLLSSKSTPSCTLPVFFTQLSGEAKGYIKD